MFLERLSTIISSISTFFTSNSQEYCLVNLIKIYTMAEDRIADGSPGHMSRPEADATPLTGLLQGLQASIAQITQASLSQTEAFKNLKEDLLLLPDSQDERSDEEPKSQRAKPRRRRPNGRRECLARHQQRRPRGKVGRWPRSTLHDRAGYY